MFWSTRRRNKHGSRSRSNRKPYDVPVVKPYNYEPPKSKEKQSMSDFTYTDSIENIDSTAVEAAWYNVHDKTLVVALVESEKSYLYTGVPSWVWSQFKGTESKGSFYATQIKRNFGPGTLLDWTMDLELEKYGVPAPSMASVTPISENRVTLGTPKGLTYASDAQVTTKAEAFPLSTPAAAPKSKTSVVFAVAGKEKTANFDDVDNVDDAVREINRLADMLGLDELTIKAVTVHFE